MKRLPKTYWKNGELMVRCPYCSKTWAGGAWLAAHSMFDDIKAVCENEHCSKKFELGKIKGPPKEIPE